MKVILLQELTKLGSPGDVVYVADGYARNYLIPRGLAEAATAQRLKEVEQQKEKQAKMEEKALAEAQSTAQKMEQVTLRVKTKAGEEGRLFGSITNSDIADLLAEKGFTVDKKKIDLPDPIKSLGEHTVEVKLHKEVIVPVPVQVEAE